MWGSSPLPGGARGRSRGRDVDVSVCSSCRGRGVVSNRSWAETLRCQPDMQTLLDLCPLGPESSDDPDCRAVVWGDWTVSDLRERPQSLSTQGFCSAAVSLPKGTSAGQSTSLQCCLGGQGLDQEGHCSPSPVTLPGGTCTLLDLRDPTPSCPRPPVLLSPTPCSPAPPLLPAPAPAFLLPPEPPPPQALPYSGLRLGLGLLCL